MFVDVQYIHDSMYLGDMTTGGIKPTTFEKLAQCFADWAVQFGRSECDISEVSLVP